MPPDNSSNSGEWMRSVRSRLHDLSNIVQQQEGAIVRLQERQTQLRDDVTKVEAVVPVIHELKHQASVLKWILATATAAVIGILAKLF